MDLIMRLRIHARAFAGAAIFTASTLVAAYGLAAPDDYRFELVQAQPAGSGAAGGFRQNHRHGSAGSRA